MLIDNPFALIEAGFARHSETGDRAPLCLVSAETMDVTAVGINLRSDSHSEIVCASDVASGKWEEIQIALGDGPCVDAFNQRRRIFEPDLASSPARWPGFSPPALELGLRAVFAFPLRNAGGSPFGVMTLYQTHAGPLSDQQLVTGPLLVEVVSQKLLSDTGGPVTALDWSADHRAEVHQATGMIAVQLSLGIVEASLRLRAYAFSVDRPLADVAAEVVKGTLSLSPDPTPGGRT